MSPQTDERWSRRSTPIPNLVWLGIIGLLLEDVPFFPAWLRGLGLLVFLVCFIWEVAIDIGRWRANRR